MPTHASSTFTPSTWDEETASEVDGHLKITHAKVTFSYSGDLQGESAMQYLMLYRDDGSAAVIGLERVSGALCGKQGTFVLQYQGGYADKTFSGDFEVVEGSASGDLAGLGGRGSAVAHKDGTTAFSFDFDLPAQ
jgi:Protein of unknown function (DUF3224)